MGNSSTYKQLPLNEFQQRTKKKSSNAHIQRKKAITIMLFILVAFIVFLSFVAPKNTHLTTSTQGKKKQTGRPESEDDSDGNDGSDDSDGRIDKIDDVLKSRYSSNMMYLEEQFFLGYQLYTNSSFPQQLETSYFERKYKISMYEEASLCIVASFYNNMKENRQERFLQSVRRMKYEKYRLVLVDDDSTDSTVSFTQSYLTTHPQLERKTTLITHQQQKGSLYCRNMAITEHCEEGDIILDVDGDGAFIGKEGFRVVNALYACQPQLWYIYSNYLTRDIDGRWESGICGIIPDVGTYRTSNLWLAGHLKTYRRELYMKIDQDDFVENGQFHRWAADRYIQYALVELASTPHTLYYQPLALYYYDQTEVWGKNFDLTLPYQLHAQMFTPYQPLPSLSHPQARLSNYHIPAQLEQKQLKYRGKK